MKPKPLISHIKSIFYRWKQEQAGGPDCDREIENETENLDEDQSQEEDTGQNTERP